MSLPIEVKPHPKFPNYGVTKDGRVWSIRRNKWLKPGNHTQGYKIVILSNKGKHTTAFVHRLVLETYISLCPEDMEALHKNGNVADNKLSNLEWSTHSNNMLDKNKHNTGNYSKGEKHYRTSLLNKNIKNIRYVYNKGLFTQIELAKRYKISNVQISRIINRKEWKYIGD